MLSYGKMFQNNPKHRSHLDMDGGPDDQLAQCTTGASHRFRWNDLPDAAAQRKDLPLDLRALLEG